MKQQILKRILSAGLSTILVLSFLSGCSNDLPDFGNNLSTISEAANTETNNTQEQAKPKLTSNPQKLFNIKDVPNYSGKPFIEVNDNKPYFTEDEKVTDSFESYSDLDKLGRCGIAFACIGEDLMPLDNDRGEIGYLKPSGYQSTKYDIVEGKYLYNRCHLIAFSLAGETANEKNLITGTRYLNVNGMLQFETKVHDYVDKTHNHVMYRVTPFFDSDNLLASGVLMEAVSVEDSGKGIEFNVYCYNAQPNININYKDGTSSLIQPPTTVAPKTEPPASKAESVAEEKAEKEENDNDEQEVEEDNHDSSATYILNTNTKKFHLPHCSSVDKMSNKNKKEFTGSRDEVISMGYSPCKRCNP